MHRVYLHRVIYWAVHTPGARDRPSLEAFQATYPAMEVHRY